MADFNPKGEYAAKLRDPRWQRKRLEVMQRDGWTCQRCRSTEKTLNVHHLYYRRGCDPWEYPMDAFQTLCEDCHAVISGKAAAPPNQGSAGRPSRFSTVVGRFIGVKSAGNHPEYGPSLRWEWRVQGPTNGQVAYKVTGDSPTTKNACGRTLRNVVGREVKVGEEVNLDHYFGGLYLLVVDAEMRVMGIEAT